MINISFYINISADFGFSFHWSTNSIKKIICNKRFYNDNQNILISKVDCRRYIKTAENLKTSSFSKLAIVTIVTMVTATIAREPPDHIYLAKRHDRLR